MLQYLALQFSRAEILGRQSEIYLASLDSAAADTQLARRWQAINRELERYRLKNPNGSLVLYEQFLTSLGADTDRSNCTEKLLGKAPGSRPGDYFAERHLQVYNALLKRCTDLRLGEQRAQWTNFSDRFNRLLAGRQPFAVPSARYTPEADFNEVGQVLAGLPNSVPPGTAARRFVEQLGRVRTFLAPLYPTEEGALAGYDVGVEFRVNQLAEVEGNQVIDWTLEMGRQSLRLRDAPRPLRWEPGMPIKLTLRLANDAPLGPAADPTQPAMAVDGKSVSYQFSDVWSLVRMIQQQREPDPTGRADVRSQLLRLEFPLVSEVGNAVKLLPIPAGRARVYLRLTLSPVGKRTAVAWPVTFPTRAPDFNGQ
jgi:type VI secretion system protein ImpL